MSAPVKSLVSIVTPVYNGEAYLAECIDSVLAQTHSNWQYTIVSNCSTDGTVDIAQRYGRKDPRITVYEAKDFLPIIANHNRAFRLISPDSQYCKVVSADDWLYPECIAKMVQLAEANPSIGIVGSYQLSGGGDKWYIRFTGLPCNTMVISGRSICRSQLLTDLSVFGAPTSNMYRSDLVRSTDSFFPNPAAEADVSACFGALKGADFGFVHQVLSYERLHNVRTTTTSERLEAYISAKISDLVTYGPFYLTLSERERRLEELMDEYYKVLAVGAVNFRGKSFWAYHRKRLGELGFSLDRIRLGKAIGAKVGDLVLNPKQSLERVRRRVRPRTRVSGLSFLSEEETAL